MTSRRLTLMLILAAACGGPLEDEADQDLAAGGNSEVVVYSEDAWSELADALAADASPRASFFMHIPAPSNDKTWPRGPLEPVRMRARGPRFHALAEFHWGEQSKAPGTWYEKGVEFRRRMVERGYDVSAGDSWAINELPSSTRKEASVRQHVRDAVRGLYEGPAGSPHVMGAVFVIGVGSNMVNFSVYKPDLERWLADSAFWTEMSPRVRFWGQETYTAPATSCVPGVHVAARSDAINQFIEHVPTLAAAGPASAKAAREFFAKAYVPLLNGAFRSDAYQTGGVSLELMKHFVSNQLYAARAWAGHHAYPGNRVGLGWTWRRGDVTAAELHELAARIASAVHHAWDEDGGAAAGACSPSRAYTWCQCSEQGAAFNDAWSFFTHW